MRALSLRQFTILLLASGASGVALSSSAHSAPLNPVALTPSILLPIGESAVLAAPAVTSQSERTFTNLRSDPSLQTAGFFPVSSDLSLPFSSGDEVAQTVVMGDGLSFSNFDLGAQSSVSVHRAQVQLRPTLDGSFDHLGQGMNFGLPTDAVNSGVDADLFDGRLKVSSDITMTNETRPLGLRPGEDVNSVTDTDAAYRHSFAAKMVDRDSFHWSLAGQMGQVDPRFADFIFTEPGDKSPALRWSSMATRLDFGLASLSVGYDDVTRLDQVESNRKLTFGFNQSALSVYQRNASQFSLDQGGHWLKRTAVVGASAEVIVADVLPSKLSETLSSVTPFLPNTISVSYEEGDALQPDGPDAAGTPAERVRSMSGDFTWKTRLGETTASYWSRQIKADADQLRLETASDRVIDLDHSIKRGNWRFGAGVSFIESTDETPVSHSEQTRIAPHISFAYEAENFPRLEVRVGAADANTIVGVDDMPASAKARQLQISVDLSNFVQDELNRPEARLRVEYRRELETTDDNLGGRFAREGDQALLLTFSTPLN